jgi:hypothetical protein
MHVRAGGAARWRGCWTSGLAGGIHRQQQQQREDHAAASGAKKETSSAEPKVIQRATRRLRSAVCSAAVPGKQCDYERSRRGGNEVCLSYEGMSSASGVAHTSGMCWTLRHVNRGPYSSTSVDCRSGASHTPSRRRGWVGHLSSVPPQRPEVRRLHLIIHALSGRTVVAFRQRTHELRWLVDRLRRLTGWVVPVRHALREWPY